MSNGFKKHQPKRFDGRRSIRRDYCIFCDGVDPLMETVPPYLIAVDEEINLPFRIQSFVDATNKGLMQIRLTVPHNGMKSVFIKPRQLDFSRDSPVLFEPEFREIKPEKWARVGQINYCPMCGRDLSNDRPRLFKEAIGRKKR